LFLYLAHSVPRVSSLRPFRFTTQHTNRHHSLAAAGGSGVMEISNEGHVLGARGQEGLLLPSWQGATAAMVGSAGAWAELAEEKSLLCWDELLSSIHIEANAEGPSAA
jgi:hypothetical protein